MSNDVIITVEHLSKRYKLGQIGATSVGFYSTGEE